MHITQRLVLPTDVALTPHDSDYAISRERGRGAAHIIDAEAATLVESFRTARTIVDAVIAYGRSTNRDPERTLVEAWPMLRRLVDSGVLVPDGTGLADAIAATYDVGERIDRWTVVTCVHLLADTEVYQVRDETGRYGALKLARLSDELGHALQFEHEAHVLEHLHDTIAPRLVARGVAGGAPYLVTDWCDGIDIAHAADELRPRRGAVVALVRALLDAYGALHEQGVLHGDVHPHNILVDARGRVRLLDFGYTRVGVAFYREPESVGTDAPVTAAGEQYALGALIYFLVTGSHYRDFPLDRASFERMIVDGPPLSFAERGVEPWPPMEAVLARALAKTPGSRFPSVRDMAAALPAWADDAVPTTRVGALPRAILSDVLGRAQTAPPYETAPTASVVSGMAGLAFMLYRVALQRDSAELLALADRWAARAAAAARSSSSAFIDAAVSPYHTASGVHCVQALIANAGGDDESLVDAVNAYLAAVRAPCTSPELMFGSAGVLVATALLVDALAATHPALARRLVESGDRIFDATQHGGSLSVAGLAHGQAGVLYASLRWCEVTGRRPPPIVEARLDELASHGEPWGRGMRWPHTLDPADPLRRTYLSGWCNGTAGFVHLWTLAGRDELAERAAWHVWENLPDVGGGSLCCGTAGAAYALLARAAYDPAWRDRAIAVADRAARAIVHEQDARDGLWYGEVGVAVLAADLDGDGLPCMPFFSGEGWPSGSVRSSDRS